MLNIASKDQIKVDKWKGLWSLNFGIIFNEIVLWILSFSSLHSSWSFHLCFWNIKSHYSAKKILNRIKQLLHGLFPLELVYLGKKYMNFRRNIGKNSTLQNQSILFFIIIFMILFLKKVDMIVESSFNVLKR